MANEPSLGEIANVAASSGSQAGTPATIFDNRQLLDILTTSAKQRAQNDMQRYHIFLDNLNQLSQDANAIAGMEVLPQDREALEKQAHEIFALAASDPKALSGRGPQGIILREKLAKWKSDATLSKQNNTFDFAHRQLLEQNPSFQTDENKKQVEDYTKAPLGQRKEYLLNLPTQLDVAAMVKGTLDSPFVTQKYARKDETGQFIEEGKRTSYDAFVTTMGAGYDANPDIRKYAQEQFVRLPKNIQDQYKDKEGNPDFKKFWTDMTGGYFSSEIDPSTGKKRDIINVEKVIQNPFVLAEKRAEDRLRELGAKFNYDKRLESIKQGGKVSIELMKEKAKAQPSKDRKKWLQDTTDAMINFATKNGKPFSQEGFDGKEMSVSNATLKLFSSTNALGKPLAPSKLIVNADGTITSLFYTVDEKGNVKMSEDDKRKSQTYTQEEFKARFGKDILGQKVAGEELSDEDIDVPDDTTNYTIPDDNTDTKEQEVEASVDVSTLNDGDYKIKDGKNKGKTVTVKGGKVFSIK